MFNFSNLICLKLKSNSGNKLTDNQLVSISEIDKLPLEFLVQLRASSYSKIWFTMEVNSGITELRQFAYSQGHDEIYLFESTEQVSQNLKEQLKAARTLFIPKSDVIVDQNQLDQILRFEQFRELNTVLEPYEINEEINIEQSIDWNKVICIEIRKYNQDYLKSISKKLNLEIHHLIVLKEKDVSMIYWDTSRPYFIGYLVEEELSQSYRNSYKGLYLWNSVYGFLSKKDKDRLLKMSPIDIKILLKGGSIRSYRNINHNTQSLETPLEVDKILDKISKFGMGALTAEERKFLDEESKK